MNRAWWALGLALGAGIVWLVGLVALGVWNEDICLADGIPSASAYTQSLRVWPPAMVCGYVGAGSSETVTHTFRGLAVVGWTYVMPLLAVASLVTWASFPSWRAGEQPG